MRNDETSKIDSSSSSPYSRMRCFCTNPPRLCLIIVLATFLVDQANKFWFLHILDLDQKGRIAVFPFLDLILVKNTGISYSLFLQETQVGQYVLAALACFLCLLFWLWFLRSDTTRFLAVSFGLIIGGAMGNVIDRLVYGGVIDFYSLHSFGYYWYVFNMADVAIVIGVLVLLYDTLITEKGRSRGSS